MTGRASSPARRGRVAGLDEQQWRAISPRRFRSGSRWALNLIGQGTGHEVEATIDHSVVTASGDCRLDRHVDCRHRDPGGGRIGLGEGHGCGVHYLARRSPAQCSERGEHRPGQSRPDIASDSDVTTAAGSGGNITLTSTESTKLIRADAFGKRLAAAYAAATAFGHHGRRGRRRGDRGEQREHHGQVLHRRLEGPGRCRGSRSTP